MNLEQLIYEGLQEQHGATPEVFLEDLLRLSCGYRHYLRLSEAEGTAERGSRILIQETGLRLRRTICDYLKGCFVHDFTAGSYRMQGAVTLLVDGFVKGRMVEVSVVSTREFNNTRPPRRSVLSAAVKAHLLGVEEATLILVDRNSQEWMLWTVSGDFTQAAEPVLKDIQYVTKLLAGEAIPIGMAGPTTCRQCPYNDTCSVPKEPDPPNYELHGVKAVQDLELLQEVEAHLWKLNTVENGRAKKVLHPSSFSSNKCDREQAYDLLGTDEDERVNPKLRRIFDVGHCFHDLIQEILEWKVPGFQAETLVRHEELRIHGHCDGEFGENGVEIKSISQSGFDKLTKPKADHVRQATLYGAIRNLTRIHYIYVNKETGELKVIPVPLSRSSWHKQATRASNIIKTVDAGNLPPPIDQEYTCRKCKYAWTCKPQRRTQVQRTFR